MTDLSFSLPAGVLRLSPTDLSQFVRLEQCERYLRLRLYEHRHGQTFFGDYDVQAQRIPELLTRPGRRFEERIEAAIAGRYDTINFDDKWRGPGKRPADNGQFLEIVRSLPAGAPRFHFQVQVQVDIGGWRLTGIADLI